MCKIQAVLALAFATVAIANAQYNVHPCQGHADGFARDLHSCAHYWRCDRGQGTRGKCQNGRLFDAETQACLLRDQVECFQCPPNGYSLISVPGACPQYLQCFHGSVTLDTCPQGLVFDGRRSVKNCNREPYHGGCYREGNSTVDNPVSARCPLVAGGPVFIRDKHSCSVFYVCSTTGDIPERRECDSGLHFNTALGKCDYPHSAGCADQDPPESETLPPRPTRWTPTPAPTRPTYWKPTPTRPSQRPPYGGVPAETCPLQGGVYVPDRFDCNMYHMCIRGGGSRALRCSPGHHFDMRDRTCKLPRDAQCYSHVFPSYSKVSETDIHPFEREPQDSSSSEEGIFCRSGTCAAVEETEKN